MRRSNAAIDADDIGAGGLQSRYELLRRCAIEAVTFVLDRHLRDDRQRAAALHRRNRRDDLVHVAERLEHQQIDAALDQRLCLLSEIGLGFVSGGLTPRLDAQPERTDRARDIDVLAGGLARQLRASAVDLAHLVGQTKRPQLDAIGAERVGLNHIGAGAHVFVVHVGYAGGIGEVERVEAAIDEDTLRVEQRAHRAVADQHAGVEGGEERRQFAGGRAPARRGNEQISLVPDEVVLAVDGELVVLAHEDRRDRTGLFAHAAEDAACLVNLIDARVARTGHHRPVVLRRLQIDRVRRTGHRAQTAGDALLEAVLVAHQHLLDRDTSGIPGLSDTDS